MEVEVYLEDGEIVIMRSVIEAFLFAEANRDVHTIAFVDGVINLSTKLVRDRPGGVMWHQRSNDQKNPNQGELYA